jgi:hypothetical protein
MDVGPCLPSAVVDCLQKGAKGRTFGELRYNRSCPEDALISETAEMIEVPWQEGARLLDDCTYLFAVNVRELEELTLGLTLVEAKAQPPITGTKSVCLF